MKICRAEVSSIFVIFISLIQTIAEIIVSSIFYFNGQSDASFTFVVIGLVGVGTLIHSTIDFIIAAFVWVPLQKVISIPVNAKIRMNPARN